MKYLGYGIAAIAGFFAGLCYRSRSRCSEIPTVYIKVKKSGDQWTKAVSPDPAETIVNDVIVWIVQCADVEGERVEITKFRTKGGPKMPLLGHPHGTIEKGVATLVGYVRDKDLFPEHPPATDHSQEHGWSQVFTYTLKIGNKEIDPDIRVREY